MAKATLTDFTGLTEAGSWVTLDEGPPPSERVGDFGYPSFARIDDWPKVARAVQSLTPYWRALFSSDEDSPGDSYFQGLTFGFTNTQLASLSQHKKFRIDTEDSTEVALFVRYNDGTDDLPEWTAGSGYSAKFNSTNGTHVGMSIPGGIVVDPDASRIVRFGENVTFTLDSGVTFFCNTDIDLTSLGNKLIFDADGDSYFTCPSDDTIELYVGGNLNTYLNTTGLFVYKDDDGASQGPTFVLDRHSDSPADNDIIGSIEYRGRNGAAGTEVYGEIQGRIADVSDEDGKLIFYCLEGGSQVAYMQFEGGDADQAHVAMARPLRINVTADAGVSSVDHGFQVGLTTASNIIMDGNEIMSRNNGSASTLFVNHEGGSVQIHEGVASGTYGLTLSSGGALMGNATGGAQGAGTFNARAVYDDGSILTPYVFEALRDGSVNLERLNAKVLNRVLGDLDKATGERKNIVVEERTHRQAADFARNLDSLDPRTFYEKCLRRGHLPAMPSEAEWEDAGGKIGTGKLITALTETVELQAVHIGRLEERIHALEGGLPRANVTYTPRPVTPQNRRHWRDN